MSLPALFALLACARHEAPAAALASAPGQAALIQPVEPSACVDPQPPLPQPDGAPTPRNEPLPPGDGPTLALARAWFYKDPGTSKPIPGPAQVLLFRQTPSGWVSSRLEDGDSNVFHQSFRLGPGLVTLGAERALLRLWTPGPEGWSAQTLYEGAWCGKFDRLRELERGNIDRDRPEEWVIATHDEGVVVVLDGIPGRQRPVELDRQPDTYVHEIALGDLDGDGMDEILATRTRRGGLTPHAEVVRYRWTEAGFLRDVLWTDEQREAREILVADLDGDGRDELYASIGPGLSSREEPRVVDLRRFRWRKGAWNTETLASIEDRSVRFLLDADLNGDGARELVATGMKTGVYWLKPQREAPWPMTRISESSGGFEHAAVALDLDGDGRDELYVADDDHGELERLTLDPASGAWRDEVIGDLGRDAFTWNISQGP